MCCIFRVYLNVPNVSKSGSLSLLEPSGPVQACNGVALPYILCEKFVKWHFFLVNYLLMRWAGHVARMGERWGVYSVLVGKPEGKVPLGRPRNNWDINIKMDLREVGCGRMDWIELAQDRDRWRALETALTFKRRIKSHMPFAGIIRSSPYSPRFQDNG